MYNECTCWDGNAAYGSHDGPTLAYIHKYMSTILTYEPSCYERCRFTNLLQSMHCAAAAEFHNHFVPFMNCHGVTCGHVVSL